MWEGLSKWLGGAKDWLGSQSNEDLSVLLGSAGAAVSPKDSWQQRLGSTAAKLGAQEQSRKYLSDLLGASAENESEAESDSSSSSSKNSSKSESRLGPLKEKSNLSTGQLDALRNPGLGDVLSDYFSVTLPKQGGK